MVGGRVQEQQKMNFTYGFFKLKKNNLSEFDSDNEALEFLSFIVLESLEETCLAKLSPFLIKKVISSKATPWTVKKIRNGNLLVEVDSWRPAENILKIKTFHMTKCKVYPYEKLNNLKGVIRSRELSLTISEEITAALRKQGVTDYKRIIIRKSREDI